MLINHFTTNQVSLNDDLENLRVTISIPSPFRVDHSDGSIGTDTQAMGLVALDAT
jgi:hypothetical protein